MCRNRRDLNPNLPRLLLTDSEHAFVAGDFVGGAHGFVGVVGEFDGGGAVGFDRFTDEREGGEGVSVGEADKVVGEHGAPAKGGLYAPTELV